MRKTSAPKSTPSTVPSDSKTTKSEVDQRAEFLSTAFSLSWQLAIVVLVPVVGGYKIDEHFHKLPLYTIIGFVIAIVGAILLLRQILIGFNQRISK